MTWDGKIRRRKRKECDELRRANEDMKGRRIRRQMAGRGEEGRGPEEERSKRMKGGEEIRSRRKERG